MSAPAGWYDDGSGRQRWWDGGQWTQSFAEVDESGFLTATSEAPRPARSKRLWIVIGAVIGGLLLAGAAAVASVVIIANSVNSGPADSVMAYNEAWDDNECVLLQTVTTPQFLSESTVDCTQFTQRVEEFRRSTPDGYKVEITNVEVHDQTATVTTTESYVENGIPHTLLCEYGLERTSDRWLIYKLTYEELNAP